MKLWKYHKDYQCEKPERAEQLSSNLLTYFSDLESVLAALKLSRNVIWVGVAEGLGI